MNIVTTVQKITTSLYETQAFQWKNSRMAADFDGYSVPTIFTMGARALKHRRS